MSEEAKNEETRLAEEVSTEPAGGVMPLPLDPDLEFVQTIAEWGGGDLKSCFQCATCSVICPLSPDVNPFPRKEIIWAQWGFKDRLVNDPDLWLCHRCNDCSEYCPRGAKTGDVMSALRSYAYQAHAWPRFLGRWLNQPSMLPILLAVPLLAIYALIRFAGNLEAPLGNSPELASQYFGNMIQPWPWLDLVFLGVAGFALLAFGIGIRRAWRGFMQSGVQPDLTPKRSIPASVWLAIKDILLHAKFRQCGAGQARRIPHMLILFGFGALFVTTVLVFVGMYAGFGLQTPLALDHPIKLLGNAGTVAISLGLILTIVHRANPAERVAYGRSAYQDIVFLTVLTLVVLTGLMSELFRLAAYHDGAAVSYFLHLAFIFFLFLYAPYSKFAHVLYFATALTWAHHVGRELKTLPAEALPERAAAAKGAGQKAA